MTNEGLSKNVSDLIRERLHSFEALEALMRLRAEPREWTAAEVGDCLKIDRDDATTALEELEAQSLIVMSGDRSTRRWRYAPDAQIVRAVEALAHAYENARLDVMNAMAKNALDRIRLSAVRTFADAFRFGKKGKDG